MPLVTVYIPCRNYGRYLPEAVDSVLAQLYSNWELFIIDEASSDNTGETAARYSVGNPDKIKVISNEKPLGLQRVANCVLSLANGKYLMRLDADDWLDEGALLLMVTKFESKPELDLVFANYYYTSTDGDVKGVERRDKLGRSKSVAYHPPHGACTMVRTRTLKRVGGYSEDINAQDGWELWYKLGRHGEAAHIETPLFYYRQHDQSLSRDHKRLLAARAKIFDRAAKAMHGQYKPTCSAVIGVRESYPNVSGVPYKDYKGFSLLVRALNSAASPALISDIVVSSDSAAVLDYCRNLEASGRVRPHRRLLRSNIVAKGSVPMREIMLQAGETHFAHYGAYPDIVAFLSVHAAGRKRAHVAKAINCMLISGSDSVVSVCEQREPIFKHGEEGLYLLNPGRFKDLSHDKERFFFYNGVILAVWWDVLKAGELLGRKVSYIEMSIDDSLRIPSH